MRRKGGGERRILLTSPPQWLARSLNLSVLCHSFPTPFSRLFNGEALRFLYLYRVGKLEDASAMATKQDSSEASSAWVPDPVIGYYRPINHSPEIDPAELRVLLLNHKVRSPTHSS